MRMAKSSHDKGGASLQASRRPRLRAVAPLPDSEAGALGFRAFQPLLDRLPIAAAIATVADAGIQIVAENGRFSTLAQVRAWPRPIVITSDHPVIVGMRALLTDPDAVPPAGFDWRDGDSVGGRHFRIHIARLEMPPGAPPACLVSLVDRTVELESARSLRAELLHDSLTGLPNRIAFAEAVDELVARQGVDAHAVLLVDLARFSRVNESLGAMAGDEVIITVARRLISTLRAGDLLARVGGDEFGVLLRSRRSRRGCSRRRKRIQAVLASAVPALAVRDRARMRDRLRARRCGSCGDDPASGEELVRNAQFALKRAKSDRARSRSTAPARRRARASSSMSRPSCAARSSIGDAAARLSSRSSISAASRLVGFEALSRWHHPVRGAIDPVRVHPGRRGGRR